MTALTLQHDTTNEAPSKNASSIRFNTLPEANYWADVLAVLTPNPVNTYFGLCELFINSVVHGIQKKNQANNAFVYVHISVMDDCIMFDIKDDGDGFDWNLFLNLDDKRMLDKSGRGIALARHLSFDEITYLGTGNHVRCCINLTPKGSGM